MKKKFLISAILTTVLMLVSIPAYASAPAATLIINGNVIHADLKVINGTTYVPLRVISEHLEDVDLYYNSATNTITMNQRKTNDPSQTPMSPPSTTALTGKELEEYLSNHFSKLTTSLGETILYFSIEENNSDLHPYDYCIKVKYDPKFYENLKDVADNPSAQREKIILDVRSELRAHMESIAKSAIAVMPGKKLCGYYYYENANEPAKQAELAKFKTNAWQNYDGSSSTKYTDSKITQFQWTTSEVNGVK
ncbi:copper amine oxidase N-terminal domain-containing protein [Paenibacillus sp. p3-SID1389]|uniref:copper amine oxidase N-terminal domain-containing protein n=1 Tax=Paenibacillus sp. p3-SID1389 TaxID=2916364 RepID=UPI0021A2CA3A|nr:copper amine oxidase N-terminal domain-containing protein [Paenibacillus sp. p3-SID1389]MCT2195303.1 copper amine oxidase N-terminal domain-containing protein [Paenibacillus sp. p3-SID1389]